MNIYYFTGTGNSIDIFNELKKSLPEANAKPIAGYLNDDKVVDDSDVVGFILPVYFLTMPDIFKDFIRKLTLKKEAYTFAVIHYGNMAGSTAHDLNKLLNEIGNELNSSFAIALPDNAVLAATPADKNRERLKNLPNVVEGFAKQIKSKEITPLIGNSGIMPVIIRTSTKFVFDKIVERKKTTDNCTHCGICEKVCPVNDIKVSEDSVTFGKNCAQCFACIHWCPQRAIKFGFMKINDKTHYTNPRINVGDVISQKKKQ